MAYIAKMPILSVKCVECSKMWEKESVIAWGPDDYSGSLCKACFLEFISPTIRKKQLKKGSTACFGRKQGCCDQHECKYRRWCLDMDKVRDTENAKAA
jgi:hypothetical protein